MKKEDIEAYTAVADPKAVAATVSPFQIEVRFLEGLTDTQKSAFATAARRWCNIIVGDLPAVMVDGEVIDDLQIFAQGLDIDGPGRILGQAGPTRLRPASAGKAAFLPAVGRMSFDTADLARMESAGTLADVITHEMGHVLGIGTIWSRKSLITGAGTFNPTFRGKFGNEEFGRLKAVATPVPIPIENRGGPGTADGHWRDLVFGNELMTGFVGSAGNPISRMTVASLKDMGYTVNFDAADPYELPDIASLAEMGLLADEVTDQGLVLPSIPIVLPDESLEFA